MIFELGQQIFICSLGIWRSVVLYGEGGTGKSLFINLITGGNVARKSPDAVVSTCMYHQYVGMKIVKCTGQVKRKRKRQGLTRYKRN